MAFLQLQSILFVFTIFTQKYIVYVFFKSSADLGNQGRANDSLKSLNLTIYTIGMGLKKTARFSICYYILSQKIFRFCKNPFYNVSHFIHCFICICQIEYIARGRVLEHTLESFWLRQILSKLIKLFYLHKIIKVSLWFECK